IQPALRPRHWTQILDVRCPGRLGGFSTVASRMNHLRTRRKATEFPIGAGIKAGRKRLDHAEEFGSHPILARDSSLDSASWGFPGSTCDTSLAPWSRRVPRLCPTDQLWQSDPNVDLQHDPAR